MRGAPTRKEETMKRSIKISIALLLTLTGMLSGCIIWPGWWDEGGGRGGHEHHHGDGYEHERRY